jgi:peptide/nickel transport system substrate-binding protein
VLYTRATTTLEAINRNEIQAGFLREAPVIKTAKDAKLAYIESLYWAGGIMLINNGYQITCTAGKPAASCSGKADGTKVPTVTPTSDKRIRQAVSLAVNPATYNERVNEGKGYPGSELFQKTSKWFNGVPGPVYDLAKAKALVDQIKAEGKWDGSVRLSCHSGRPEWATLMETLLKSAGFTVKIKNDYDVSGLIADITVNHDYDIACWGINIAEEAPFINLSQNLGSTSASNWTGYANPEFDAAMTQLQMATTDDAQKAALKIASTRIAEDLPIVIYDAVPETVVSGKATHGITANVASMVFLDKAWIG